MPLLLEGGTDNRDQVIAELRKKLQATEEELAVERVRRNTTEAGARNLKETLAPLYRALQMVFGDLDAMGLTGGHAAAGTTAESDGLSEAKRAIWRSWQEKMPGRPAQFIDLLLVHGAMTHQQLKIAARGGNTTVRDTLSRLTKAGLIEKNGGKVSLKKV